MIFNNNFDMIRNHLYNVGTISLREASNDYGMSGGHLTKVISVLRKEGMTISGQWRNHPVTGRRYMRYYLAA